MKTTVGLIIIVVLLLACMTPSVAVEECFTGGWQTSCSETTTYPGATFLAFSVNKTLVGNDTAVTEWRSKETSSFFSFKQWTPLDYDVHFHIGNGTWGETTVYSAGSGHFYLGGAGLDSARVVFDTFSWDNCPSCNTIYIHPDNHRDMWNAAERTGCSADQTYPDVTSYGGRLSYNTTAHYVTNWYKQSDVLFCYTGGVGVEIEDLDMDGIPDHLDPDVDGDGIINRLDPDIDDDGILNIYDDDIDGDGVPNEYDPYPNGLDETPDKDNDGIPDYLDPDIDGDGVLNPIDRDVDGDGIWNGEDPDVDDDGLPNPYDIDIDGDDIWNDIDPDKDGDGTPNEDDTEPSGSSYMASIIVSPTSGSLPLYVTVRDFSQNFPEEYPYPTYHIDFDDGTTFDGERQYTGEYWFHTYEYSGTYTITYNVTYDGDTYTDTQDVIVGDAISNFYVQVSGVNGTAITGANTSLYINGVYQSSVGTSGMGRAYFNVSDKTLVTGTVNKSGYQDGSFSHYIDTWDTWMHVTLYLTSETIPEDEYTYNNLVLTVRDKKTNEVIKDKTVFVKIYSDSGRETLYSSEYTTTGYYTALVPADTTHYYTIESSNYFDYLFSKSINTTTYMTVLLNSVLNPIGDTDGDGIPDMDDPDIDDDGIPNQDDPDIDGDGIPNDEDEYESGGEPSLSPNLHVWVYSTSGSPINGATVSIESSGGDDGTHATNSTGHSIHFCDEIASGKSRQYHIAVSRGGYISQETDITVSTQNPSVSFYLAPTTGVSSTATPTAVYTPVPIPTWSGISGEPGTYKEMFLNFTMTQFGVGQYEAGILIGLMITFLGAVFVGGCLAGYGSGEGAGMGALIGGMFGWVGATMLGFIPIWALFVTIALIGMAFFIFRRDE